MAKTLFAIALALIAASAQSARAHTNEFSLPLRAAQLMGLKVEDTDGQKVGSVRNLILDMRTGQVRYAVIASGGFIGVHSILRLAPAQIMSAATTKRETLSLDATLDQWKGAPTFKSSQLASLAEPGQAEQIVRYFAKPDPRIASTSNTSPDSLKFASDLIGKTVVNRQHQKIGDVVDLLVGFSQTHSSFAIVSTGKFLWHGRQYAIAIPALNPLPSAGRLVVDADANILQGAPPFNQQVWESSVLSKPAVFTYSKLEP